MERWDDLRGKLASAAPEVQAQAVEDIAISVEEGIGLAVEALERGPNRYLIAERMTKLGAAYVPKLERVLDGSQTTEVRDLVALLLLRAGSRAGEAELLRAIREDHELAGLAAMTLARHRVESVAEVITEKLRVIDLQDVDRVVALFTALETLGKKAPSEFVERASKESASWQVRAMVGASPRSPP